MEPSTAPLERVLGRSQRPLVPLRRSPAWPRRPGHPGDRTRLNGRLLGLATVPHPADRIPQEVRSAMGFVGANCGSQRDQFPLDPPRRLRNVTADERLHVSTASDQARHRIRAWGSRGRRFKSGRPDQKFQVRRGTGFSLGPLSDLREPAGRLMPGQADQPLDPRHERRPLRLTWWWSGPVPDEPEEKLRWPTATR